ncbi:hypothetical protein J2W49_004670 [Hydrogenophaga palleronii]|uniref:DUF1109 domain-containing protein n=1 Tax=Hydrogenophaga palleronii TaxID=65655 RepID=A0ABU1WUM0_9BURK|nr:DUF1109 domain-containing protein [Hydrogenophaga palleronii]MDR7152692.1 hypothetical protein [Hydrogenophaga palleronii]
MKTQDLINELATGVAPVRPGAIHRQLGSALAIGTAATVTIVASTYGVRSDLSAALLEPVMWFKLAYPLLLTLVAASLVWRLAVPGRQTRGLDWTWLTPALAVLAIGLFLLWQADPSQRLPLLLGQTWRSCALSIALVSAPVLVGVLHALRRLGPTRLTQTGAIAGLLAGSVGAVAYALHCPEMSVPFIAMWNTLGIALMTGLGMWLGPRVLRW